MIRPAARRASRIHACGPTRGRASDDLVGQGVGARVRGVGVRRGGPQGRTLLARSGSVGAITVTAGRFLAAVEDGDQLWSTSTILPELDQADRAAFVEAVAAEAGRLPALLVGELPHLLVEHAEESGVELLPFGGELQASCTCSAWVDPCPHSLATAYQVAWLAEPTRSCCSPCAGCRARSSWRGCTSARPGGQRSPTTSRSRSTPPPVPPASSSSSRRARPTSSTCCTRTGSRAPPLGIGTRRPPSAAGSGRDRAAKTQKSAPTQPRSMIWFQVSRSTTPYLLGSGR